jgi:NAD(P)H-flavin reductase
MRSTGRVRCLTPSLFGVLRVQYLLLYDPDKTGVIELSSRNPTTGETTLGKVNGADGQPFFHVDGPHGAPSQHVFCYNSAIIVGAGIGQSTGCDPAPRPMALE